MRPFNHPSAFGFLWLLVLVNSADTNEDVQTSFGDPVFNSFVIVFTASSKQAHHNQRVLLSLKMCLNTLLLFVILTFELFAGYVNFSYEK